MGILDYLQLIVPSIRGVLKRLMNRPSVTCDVRGVYEAQWSPDFIPNEKGGTDAEGIEIRTKAIILLANSGPVDTTVKDAYIVCRSSKKILGQLQCRFMTTSSDYGPPLSGVVIEPRRTWGPETISIRGTLWDIDEPPKDLGAELVMEVVAQRSIKKKIKLYF